MNVLWVIGNGFDLNIGLHTGYKAFRDRAYAKDAEARANREKLESIISELGKDGEYSDRWSDLEELLGASSQGYGNDEIELFHATFIEMQNLFVEYVKSEEKRFSKSSIAQVDGGEFRLSVTNFWTRLSQVDQQQLLPITGKKESLRYKFINLNYTSCFDDYVAWVKEKHSPFASRNIDGRVYQDQASSVLHIHGSLKGDGEIVFGVGNEQQITNDSFAGNGEFLSLWTKSGKNLFYGNFKEQEMRELVKGADLFCLYGVSLGKTDCYIWEEVGKALLAKPSAQAVVFTHGLPDKRSDARKYQRICADKKLLFALACGLSGEEANTINPRVMLVPSDRVFRMKPTLTKNSKYPEPVDDGTEESETSL